MGSIGLPWVLFILCCVYGWTGPGNRNYSSHILFCMNKRTHKSKQAWIWPSLTFVMSASPQKHILQFSGKSDLITSELVKSNVADASSQSEGPVLKDLSGSNWTVLNRINILCVHGVCVFTAVCVHFGWVKRRAQIPSMGHHSWPYVTSLSLSSSSCSVSISRGFELCETWTEPVLFFF